MATKTITRNCRGCAQRRPFQKQGPNHILHLVLTVLTLGWWSPVWLLMGLANMFQPYRCGFCGGRKY
jgi:hypothetical protein